MGESKSLSRIHVDANDIVAWSAKLPTVHVDREKYLRAQFDKYCDDALLERVIELGPIKAGIPTRTVNLIAKSAINHETAMVTLISTAAGIPGGAFMWGTVPGDIAQFHGAMIRISQNWPTFMAGLSFSRTTATISMTILEAYYSRFLALCMGLLEPLEQWKKSACTSLKLQ